MLKNILAQAIAHPKNCAQLKGEKKISCPRKLPNPLQKIMVHPETDIFLRQTIISLFVWLGGKIFFEKIICQKMKKRNETKEKVRCH